MSYDVFISYSRKDTDVVDLICQAFDKYGIAYFIDRQGIGGGMEFPAVLADAILNSKLMLFVGSMNSYASKFTNSEVIFAFNKKPTGSIIPYIIDNSTLPSSLEFTFSCVNIRTIKEHPIEPILVNDICQLLKRQGTSSEKGQKYRQSNIPSEIGNEKSDEIQLVICNNGNNKYLSLEEERSVRYGFKDKHGSIVIPCIWKQVYAFHSGLALVQNENGEWGWINKAGQEVIPCKWIGAFDFSEGLACVRDKNNKLWGFIDRSGQLVIPFNWKSAGSFHEGMAFVKNDTDKYGYINHYGKVVIPFVWKDAFDFSEGLAGVRNDNWKWGFINKSGELVILCKWEGVYDFREGLCIVTNDHEVYGFIDKSGEIVIPIKYRHVRDFSNGKAYADGEYIDKTGQVVISREEVNTNAAKTIWEVAANEVNAELKYDFSFMKLSEKERLELLSDDTSKSSAVILDEIKNLSDEQRQYRLKILEKLKF